MRHRVSGFSPRERLDVGERSLDDAPDGAVRVVGVVRRHDHVGEAQQHVVGDKRPEVVALRRGIGAKDSSEEHTSELQSLMRKSYAVLCLKKKNNKSNHNTTTDQYSQKHISNN